MPSTMQNTLLVIRHPKGVIPNKAPGDAGTVPLVEVAQFLEALAGGMAPGRQGEVEVEFHRGSTDAAPARATGTVAFSSASGTVGAVVNGVTLTAAHGASDTADATTLAAAINGSADALIAGMVRACNLACTITLASVAAGEWVDIDGVRFTARTNPNGGSESEGHLEFSIAGSDTQDAAALVAKINAHPRLRDVFFASNSSGVVTLRQLQGTTGKHVFKEGAGITLGGLTSGLLAAVATVLVSSTHKSKLANQTTITASGTGVTASGARLTGGVGGDGEAKRFIS